MRRILFVALLFSSLGAAWLLVPSVADTIILRNGRTLNGRITFRDSRFTFITLYRGGELMLRNDEIASAATSDATPSRPLVSPTATPAPWFPENLPLAPAIPTVTPTWTPAPVATLEPTPAWLRPIRFRLLDKQELRTLLARRFVYHLVVEEEITAWETRELLVRLMNRYRDEEKWADAIEIRFYGLDPKGKRYEWPFALADYAPEGDWGKAAASSPRSRFLLRLKINDHIEYLRP